MGDRARARWIENTSVLPAVSITAVTPQRSCGIIKRFIEQLSVANNRVFVMSTSTVQRPSGSRSSTVDA